MVPTFDPAGSVCRFEYCLCEDSMKLAMAVF